MPGDWWRQFAGLRTLAFWQMTHPGAKLNFMGNGIAQFIEWRYYESIQWFLAEEHETHAKHREFMRALNHLYTSEPALYEYAYSAPKGSSGSMRTTRSGHHLLRAPWQEGLRRPHRRHQLQPRLLPDLSHRRAARGGLGEIFNSDDVAFGGSGKGNRKLISSVEEPMHGRENSIELTIPPLAGIILKRRGPSKNRPKAKPKAKRAASKRGAAAEKKAAEAAAPTKKASARKPSTKTKPRGAEGIGRRRILRAAKSDN